MSCGHDWGNPEEGGPLTPPPRARQVEVHGPRRPYAVTHPLSVIWMTGINTRRNKYASREEEKAVGRIAPEAEDCRNASTARMVVQLRPLSQ